MTPAGAAELIRVPFFHTPANAFTDEKALVSQTDGALLIRDGRIVASGDYETVKRSAGDTTVVDWRDGFVVPGFIDTHVHYPQLRIIGGLGRTLLDWLEHVALPEEAQMADLLYADDIADGFIHALASHGTTTALVFGAHFIAATASLFKTAASSGLRITSGLVMSDRRLMPELHQSAKDQYRDAADLIRRFHGQGRLRYAVTPRFAVSTSEAMLEVCQSLVNEHPGVRVTTHINESTGEVAEVGKLFPWATDYLAVYERYGLAGSSTVFAHNVQATPPELERLAASHASVAHCPASNAALGSGIFPLRRHLDAHVHCALGTDVGGGVGFGVLKEGLHAYLAQRLSPDGVLLRPAQLLYLSTLAGAEAMGLDSDIGDFRAGKAADLVYLRPPDGSPLAEVLTRANSMEQSLAALFTLGGAESVREVRVEGSVVYAAT
jgi:guanine deaminase